jgi:LysR family transcriptional regulator of gallate degradation
VDINLRHLQVVRAVAACGSTSAAARKVALSQPAITQAVAALERQFDARLFNRTNAGVETTEQGRLLIERIDRAFAHLRDALADITRGSARETASQMKHIERAMTTAQLKALIAVVDRGSFSQAARAAGVAQPTMHRAARDLEAIVGSALFERTSFGVQPTREAQRLARGAMLAFAEIEQARAELAAMSGGESGRTVIGAMPLARSFLLPRALIEFTDAYPRHNVSILEGAYESLLASLRSGAADFLIGAMRERLAYKDVVQEHLFDDELAIIMRAGHPLAQDKRVTAEELTQYPWIAPRPESPLHDHFDELFHAAHVPVPAATIECNSLVAARSLLLESDRLMLLSVHQIHYDLKAGLLAAIPHPLGKVTRAIALTMRARWKPTQAQERLLGTLRAYARNVN